MNSHLSAKYCLPYFLHSGDGDMVGTKTEISAVGIALTSHDMLKFKLHFPRVK